MADGDDGLDLDGVESEAVQRFETTQRLDPDAFNHAKSRVDGGFDTGVMLPLDGVWRRKVYVAREVAPGPAGLQLSCAEIRGTFNTRSRRIH